MSAPLVRAGTPTTPVTRTATALNIEPGLTFNQWRELGRELAGVGDAVAFWIGDWYAYGVANYRKDYAAGVELFERSIGGLRNLAYVSRAVEVSRRRDTLTWGHHFEVAALTPDEQDAYLTTAEMHGLSARELRNVIREDRGPDTRDHVDNRIRTLRALLGDGVLELAARAAEHRGVDPVEWAVGVLEQAARAELSLALTP